MLKNISLGISGFVYLRELILVDKSVNAGITAQQGFALQRNMALFIILDNFESKFDGAKYFLSLEHLEDIIFCFLNEQEQAVKIETYQSKKKATGNWGINKELSEIIVKMLKTGKSLIQDKYPKCKSYNHSLYFSTNSTIKLETKTDSQDNPRKKITHSKNINELEVEVGFTELEPVLKTAITKYLLQNQSYSVEELSKELNNLRFLFIGLTPLNREQENHLRGKLEEVFNKKINDYTAALDSIFNLFKKVELTYNQGNIARLSDESKHIKSTDINNAIKIITTKSKAFDYWREQTSAITKRLKIKPFDKDIFEMKFVLAFEFFKSKEQAEHRKVLDFVKAEYQSCNSYSDEDCIDELLEKFERTAESKLDGNTLKATMYAAFFESIYKTED